MLERIPNSLKNTLIGTVIIGLFAHMMCFTNIWSMEDNSAIAYGVNTSIIDGSSGGRWLFGFFNQFGMGINIPWLSGIFSLCCLGISVWAISEVFEIQDDWVRITIGGIWITSASVAVEYSYIGNIGAWSFAHLFSGVAVYTFYKVKHGKLISFFLMFLTVGIYASNVMITVSFILVKELLDIIFGREENIKKILLRQSQVVFSFIVSMGGNYLVQQLLIKIYGIEQQFRVSTSATDNVLFNGTGLQGLLSKYNQCVHEIIYNTKLTLFKSNLLLVFFVVSFILCMCLTGYVLIKKKVWGKTGILGILIFDIFCLPIAMNGMVFITQTHKLMQHAFIIPWVYIVYFVLILEKEKISPKLCNVTKYIVFCLIIITLINWIIIDNISYTKKYAHYTAGILYANRLESRLECLDDYEPGITPVCFVGTAAANCYWRTDDFNMIYEWPNVGDCGFSSAYSTNSETLKLFITQHLGSAINVVDTFEQLDLYADQLESLPEFPQKESIIWIGDTVIVNLGQINY